MAGNPFRPAYLLREESQLDNKKTKLDWLMQLRKCRKLESLEKIIQHNNDRLSNDELAAFLAAADHRLAELIMNKLYDKVPASVWRHVR